MPFSEEFLHYVWQFRLYSHEQLCTVSGESIEIISPGIHNKDAGPDFGNAKIRIDHTTWAGNVEIHLRSSDWERHQHTADLAYDNVILHVVFEHDAPVYRADGTEIPVLGLKGRIPAQIQNRYYALMQNLNWIPCEKQLAGVEEFYVRNWLSRVLVERLEERSETVNMLLEEYKGSWDDAFYVMLARNFGFKTNALPFELLARSLPQQVLAKHKNNALQIEALIFGQAGFLSGNFKDYYPGMLAREYSFLQKKYGFTPLGLHLWKFMRMRPQNFPAIRLAQFAALVIKSNHLFSKIIEIRDVASIKALFNDLPVNPYWETHFRFEREAERVSTRLGDESVNNILLNTITLFIFSYGKHFNKGYHINRALAILEFLPPETNQVIRRFNEIGLSADKADSSQALLQLKKYYCDAKKCLNCGIGIKLLNQT